MGENIRLSDSSPDVDFALYLDVFESLLAETLLAQGASTAGDWARGGTLGEDAVDAGLAHLVVAFRVHEEAHVRVEVAGGFANGADV